MALGLAAAEGARGEEALERLRSADPPLYLSPSEELSGEARAASRYLFSALVPWCPKAPPVDYLLAEEGFDAEQIWSQIDLLARPLLAVLRRELGRLEREGALGNDQVIPPGGGGEAAVEAEKGGEEEEEKDEDGFEEDEEEGDEGLQEDDGDEEEEEEEEEEKDEDDDGEGQEGGVEDRFLKIKELEEYLEEDETREYGLPEKNKRRRKQDMEEDEEGDEEEEEEEEEEDEEEDDLELGDFDDGGNEETDLAENARYEDFFKGQKRTRLEKGATQKKGSSKKAEILDDTEDLEMDDDHADDEDVKSQDKKLLSTHEKELLKMRAKIEEMEKMNLEPKIWTMQGEVTAAKRPKNSALEVDLDFEHNMRPAPVVTEEVTASLEDLIRKRIVEGHFDDVQKAPALTFKAPKEQKELDETKSKKGLAELYEEEYAQKTGLASAPLSVSDEQKKEASVLFKKLCTKLDALSHFHFAPKPVIEDMSIQVNIPALAMEEVAPVAVSDAAMLAPEEIFAGKGDIKEEAELTQAERKRRRANKKRKYKAEMSKREAKRARENVTLSRHNENQDS